MHRLIEFAAVCWPPNVDLHRAGTPNRGQTSTFLPASSQFSPDFTPDTILVWSSERSRVVVTVFLHAASLPEVAWPWNVQIAYSSVTSSALRVVVDAMRANRACLRGKASIGIVAQKGDRQGGVAFHRLRRNGPPILRS